MVWRLNQKGHGFDFLVASVFRCSFSFTCSILQVLRFCSGHLSLRTTLELEVSPELTSYICAQMLIKQITVPRRVIKGGIERKGDYCKLGMVAT